MLTYSSPADATERATERRLLQSKLTSALTTILKTRPTQPAEVELTMEYYAETTTSSRHHYFLEVFVRNVSKRRFTDWEIQIELPTVLMDGTNYGIKDDKRSNAERSIFLVDGRRLEPLRPDETRKVRLGYIIDDGIYARRDELFAKLARAHVMIDGKISAEIERPISGLQNF
ncbi:MAG: hypothetical protein U0270_11160 [Labilithrix sp.]